MIVLSTAQRRTLYALTIAYQRDRRATVRSVAKEAQRSVPTTHARLCELQRAGLVVMDRPGALRPDSSLVVVGGDVCTARRIDQAAPDNETKDDHHAR